MSVANRVIQESVIEPLLFPIFINDVYSLFQHEKPLILPIIQERFIHSHLLKKKLFHWQSKELLTGYANRLGCEIWRRMLIKVDLSTLHIALTYIWLCAHTHTHTETSRHCSRLVFEV